MGPGGLPKDLVKKIRGMMDKLVADPEFKTYMKNAGAQYGLMKSPEVLQAYCAKEVKANYELMKKLGILKKKKK